MDDGTRMALFNQMGYTIGDYGEAARLRQWQEARGHLVKLLAGLGILAVEIEENEPTEKGS